MPPGDYLEISAIEGEALVTLFKVIFASGFKLINPVVTTVSPELRPESICTLAESLTPVVTSTNFATPCLNKINFFHGPVEL